MFASSDSSDEILALYGEAILQAQRFEEAPSGLVGVCRQIEAASGNDIEALGDVDTWG